MGAPVAERALDAARAEVDRQVGAGRPRPGLVSVHRAEATPFSVYLKQQSKNAERAGLAFRAIALPPGAGAPELSALMSELDADPSVHAVLLEHPLPPEWGFRPAIDRLRPEKDVDGVGSLNLGRLAAGHPVQVPAVARAAVRIAQANGAVLEGRRVAVVGRSDTVGRPLALLLLGRGIDATVTVAHSRTRDLARALGPAEFIFACAGHPGLLDRTSVPNGAAVIDVGLSTVPDASKPSGVRIAGDADPVSLDGWASAITPVPGGVGPVTVACLMENAMRGWKLLEGIGP
jgi:methylenetetrahydrofolate dehydrogenase (NADP+) / methenyltetrahydrofolate cyclohydrolase